MVIIKIFGERNSGTNYLHKLFSKNFKNIKLDSPNGKYLMGWKHGIPKYNLLDVYEKKNKIIYVCIFRDLKMWLNSMYNKPYHIYNNTNFYDFITRNSIIRKTSNYIDFKYKHERSNLFNIRYFKFIKLLELSKKKKNVVFVKLDWLQKKKNDFVFINSLIKKFNLKHKKNFIPILKHTKNKQFGVKNAINNNYKIPLKILNKFGNKSIEKYINNLKLKFF